MINGGGSERSFDLLTNRPLLEVQLDLLPPQIILNLIPILLSHFSAELRQREHRLISDANSRNFEVRLQTIRTEVCPVIESNLGGDNT
eukprot:762972-Hanusia_phi.AAC.10